MGFPWPDAVAGAWEKHWDENSKKYFFYNRITKETTWDHPKIPLKPQPQPPPQPKPKIREQDQWCKIGDGKGKKIWYHRITGARQYEVPACRVKYRR